MCPELTKPVCIWSYFTAAHPLATFVYCLDTARLHNRAMAGTKPNMHVDIVQREMPNVVYQQPLHDDQDLTPLMLIAGWALVNNLDLK